MAKFTLFIYLTQTTEIDSRHDTQHLKQYFRNVAFIKYNVNNIKSVCFIRHELLNYKN
jgi:hypothetical protein